MEYTKKEAKAYCREHMTGVWAALTTPYTASGEVDEEGLRQIVRTCIDDLHIDGFFWKAQTIPHTPTSTSARPSS